MGLQSFLKCFKKALSALGKIEPIQHTCPFLIFSLRVSLLQTRFSLAMSYNAWKDVMI
jgi:hypothetical protein